MDLTSESNNNRLNNYSTLFNYLADNMLRNGNQSDENQLKSIEALNKTARKVIINGLILPFWQHNDHMPSVILHGVVYFVAVCYTFMGVAIIADRFMASIEKITSRQKEVIVRKPNGEEETISVRVWNETVANLTLMVLGSSAPDILLSLIEIYAKNFNAGELGPATIVGSAAFNMFTIIAVCVWCVPTSEAKKIRQLRVFSVTLVCSIFAYIWMLFILIWNSYGVIEIWEGLLTLCLFPLTILIAYAADRRFLIFKYLSKVKRRRNRKVIYGQLESELSSIDESYDFMDKPNEIKASNKNLKFVNASDKVVREVEKQRKEAIVILRAIRNKNPDFSIDDFERLAREELERLRPKSRAYYRVLNSRQLLTHKTRYILKNSIKHLNSINNDEEEDNRALKLAKINVFFDPQNYTVMKDCGNCSLTVTRTGNTEPSIIVEYVTRDGTAIAGEDYKARKGAITFGRGETRKQITIEVIHDNHYEEDERFFVILRNARYLTPQLDDNNNNNQETDIAISDAIANVVILHNDHSGVFLFDTNGYQTQESIGEFRLKVSRIIGACGRVSLPYQTISGTAKEYEDYMPAVGNLLFENNDTVKEISILIVNTHSYEKCAEFYVHLGEPKRVDSDHIDRYSPRLGTVTKCMVRIHECKQFKHIVDKLIKKSRTESTINALTWKQQFIESFTIRVSKQNPTLSYISHYATLFWRVMFAFVPPPTLYNGWACFFSSIFVIGILTALINDLASHFGATVGLLDIVTAISIVSLGTSFPDIFVCKIAAKREKYADAAIGNVTGSNAMNLFLGIGTAWTIAAIYHYFKQTPGGFSVPPGDLSFSVSLYCMFAIVCSSVLLLRRRLVGGELGGDMKYKLPTTILFVGLWATYVIASILEAYHIIPGF